MPCLAIAAPVAAAVLDTPDYVQIPGALTSHASDWHQRNYELYAVLLHPLLCRRLIKWTLEKSRQEVHSKGYLCYVIRIYCVLSFQGWSQRGLGNHPSVQSGQIVPTLSQWIFFKTQFHDFIRVTFSPNVSFRSASVSIHGSTLNFGLCWYQLEYSSTNIVVTAG